jgi:hypothetical protein
MKLALRHAAIALSALLASWTLAATARAQPTLVSAPPLPSPAPSAHPTPRLTLSYERFSAGNIDGSAMPLEALHLDMYALSWQYLRGGVDLEGGRGHATLGDATASVKYGLFGANAGFQLPGRVTPFVEGRAAAGVLGGTLDGSVTVPGTSLVVSDASAVTWMYATGIDAGTELYFAGRAYVSFGIGWIRTTWGSATYDSMSSGIDGTGLRFQNVRHDSLLLKAGLGI